MRVLVIDDDDIARELLASTIEAEGHDVFELPSAIGASREIYCQAIDAVVLDVVMPDINGDKLAKLLRGNSRGDSLVIVLVSSRPVEELEGLARGAGADAVVPKERVRADLVGALGRAERLRRGPGSPGRKKRVDEPI
jgi:DNA-binding response OmpR family regulator